MYIYDIMITYVFVCIFNPYSIICKLKGHLCTKKKRTLVSVIRDGLIPFEVGYSILILSYPTLFLLSFSFPPFVQFPDHGSSFSLFHIATRAFVNDDTNPTTAVANLHCDFSRDISAPMFARSLFSFMGKLSTSFLEFLGILAIKWCSPRFQSI